MKSGQNICHDDTRTKISALTLGGKRLIFKADNAYLAIETNSNF